MKKSIDKKEIDNLYNALYRMYHDFMPLLADCNIGLDDHPRKTENAKMLVQQCTELMDFIVNSPSAFDRPSSPNKPKKLPENLAEKLSQALAVKKPKANTLQAIVDSWIKKQETT